MNAPCVFAGDVLLETDSISDLIARGKQQVIEQENCKQKTIDVAMAEIPTSIKSGLRQYEVKLEDTSIPGMKTVSFTFDLPNLKLPIFLTVYVDIDTTKTSYRHMTSRYYYTSYINGYSMKKSADTLEQAVLFAYENNNGDGSKGAI